MIKAVVRRTPGNNSKMQSSQDSSWWSRRTKLERTLCVFTVVIFVLLIAMVAVASVFGSFYSRRPVSPAESLCLTPGCVKAAADILLNIDERVDPCTDFYQFACGGWINRHTIPEDEPSIGIPGKLSDNLMNLLKDLMEKKLDNSEPPHVKKIKVLYDSCMDLSTTEKAGSEPLKEVLSTFGGWPVVKGKEWDEKKFDWLESLISFRNFGFSHDIFFAVRVDVDKFNNKVHVIYLKKPSLSLPDRSYWYSSGLNDTTTAAYYQKMIRAAEQLGADHTTAEKELLEVLHFEMALANYVVLNFENAENENRIYGNYTVKDLQDIVPQIPWLKYLNSLLSNDIYENETISCDDLSVLKNFANLVTTTEKRVIANYMMWSVVDKSLLFLSKPWRDIAFEYRKVVRGNVREKPRSMQCISMANPDILDVALSSYYLRHYYDEKVNDLVLEISGYIHKAFKDILDKVDWMDETTQAYAKSKAENMKIVIGYPKELLNDSAVTEFFKDLIITNESYYQNVFKLQKWATDYEFSKLRKPFVRGEWTRYADMLVNAYIRKNENIIHITPGILQDPVFNKDRPFYLNFGAIGWTIGHEVTHGFDDGGRYYGKDGNAGKWWGEDSSEAFEKKAGCFINQYDNYTTEIGMQIQGEQTEDENIADNGGLKEAYLGYLSWVEDNGPELLLPGVNYNQKQLFWISGAQFYCEKSTPETLKFQILADEHAPSKFRVIGTLSNLEYFSEDFNCPLSSPMNKQPKCQIW